MCLNHFAKGSEVSEEARLRRAILLTLGVLERDSGQKRHEQTYGGVDKKRGAQIQKRRDQAAHRGADEGANAVDAAERGENPAPLRPGGHAGDVCVAGQIPHRAAEAGHEPAGDDVPDLLGPVEREERQHDE